MKNKNKLIINILKIMLLILAITTSILFIFVPELKSSDELWNFQNVAKIVNGFQIYKNANVIITPIFFYIGALFFKIFGAKMIIFRIYNIIIYLLFFFIVYKILMKLKFSKHIACMSIIIMLIEVASIITSGASYNTLSILFVLIGLYLYLSKNTNIFLHAVIMFLVFFTKQNIGITYIATVMICDLYLNGLSKKLIYNIIKKLFIFTIFTLIAIFAFYFSGNLKDFINFAFGGILEFKNKNINIDLSFSLALIAILPFIEYIFIVFQKDKLFKNVLTKEIFNNLTIIIVFTFFASFILYPIINTAHLLIVLPMHFIFIFYTFDVLILEDFFTSKNSIILIYFLCILLFIPLTLRIIIHYYLLTTDYSIIRDSQSPYYLTMMNDERISSNEILKNYIIEQNNKNIDVIIVAFDSAFPMIELRQSHGVYDLVFNGNLGYNGTEKMEKDILNKRNTEFLIFTNPDDLCYQDSTEIRNFIINNLKFKGNIEHYSIYSTN